MDLVRLLDGLAHAGAKHVVIIARFASDAEHGKVGVDEALLHQLVQGRHELPLREVAHRAEDDHRAWIGAVAHRRHTADLNARPSGDDGAGAHDLVTAWPPNSFRKAAMTLPENVSG